MIVTALYFEPGHSPPGPLPSFYSMDTGNKIVDIAFTPIQIIPRVRKKFLHFIFSLIKVHFTNLYLC